MRTELPWRTRLEIALASPEALRVMRFAELESFAYAQAIHVPRSSLAKWTSEAVAAERLQRVTRNLYLNRLVQPPAVAAEAALTLRPLSVVSLHTVLGDSGVWNNFTGEVRAIVPILRRPPRSERAPHPPKLGRMVLDGTVFVFHGMPQSVLESGEEHDRLEQRISYRRATPEAALCHWLYLARSPRSRLTMPPLDMSLADFDRARLNRLAKAMNLQEPVADWWRAAKAYAAHQNRVA